MRGAGLALVAVALGGTSLLPGCGGDDSPKDFIAVQDFDFSPAEQTFKVGEQVKWENTGEQIHNVKGKGFFSRAMNPGDTYEFTFDKPGSYDYICTLHPQMKGTIVAE